MSLIQKTGSKDANYALYLNTGTLFDLMTGQFLPGIDHHSLLNGGLSTTNAFTGRPQVFKSTTALAMAIMCMARYPGSEMFINDTEFSLGDKLRLARMSDFYLYDPVRRMQHLEDLGNRMVITNPSEDDLESFTETIKQIYLEKIGHIKDYLVETPFLNMSTMQREVMMIPTFVVVDSWSRGTVKAVMEVLDKNAASSSDTNTVFMRDSLAKNKILMQLAAIATKASIYFVCTAHVGDKIDMGGFLPSPKELQYSKQSDKIKSVGSQFNFLMSNLVNISSPKVLMDSNKQCEYPLSSGMTGPTEMSRTIMTLQRCKNHPSGATLTSVLSQTNGYEAALTNYDYLREMKLFGMGTNNRSLRPCLYPDSVLMRTTATEKLKDYKTSRAVEILAQLCYVQNNWSIEDTSVPYHITPEKLAEELTKSGASRDALLETRSWWSYGDQEREYLSLYDILAITTGAYRPKFLNLGSIKQDNTVETIKKAA